MRKTDVLLVGRTRSWPLTGTAAGLRCVVKTPESAVIILHAYLSYAPDVRGANTYDVDGRLKHAGQKDNADQGREPAH